MATQDRQTPSGKVQSATERAPGVAVKFDAIVIGTGFGGAVTACRLVEAGFRICILERGRRYEQHGFPAYPTEELFAAADDPPGGRAPSPDFSRWLWRHDQGLYDVRDLEDAVSVQAAGYGGGSLVYANVHLRPPRSVFDAWPYDYREGRLDPYFDLAAYMLRVAPTPVRLAKTMQLQRAAAALNGSPDRWFRVPLAVTFERPAAVFRNGIPVHENEYGREQDACDMRGRCYVGCNRQAKNTLDLNYLARAEDGNGGQAPPDIRTLAEVTMIERREDGGFRVSYRNFLDMRRNPCTGQMEPLISFVEAGYVFLCAGAVNTTELLLRNATALGLPDPRDGRTPLGSHYFPNADSLAAVYDCDEPQEPDFGPTITAAVLHQSEARGSFSRALEFTNGSLPAREPRPSAGTIVTGGWSGVTAVLAHEPVIDWGDWHAGTATGTLVFDGDMDGIRAGEPLRIGRATAEASSQVLRQEHWFLIEDGGYPPDFAPLAGIFRSPLWLRRNRYLERPAGRPGFTDDDQPPVSPRAFAAAGGVPLRMVGQRLRLDGFIESLAATANPTAPIDTAFALGTVSPADAGVSAATTSLLEKPLDRFFPRWFVAALGKERDAFVEQAAALALPIVGRLLDELSASVADRLDARTLKKLALGSIIEGATMVAPGDDRNEVLVRGVLRQGLQVLAGSEAAVASQAAKILIDPVPGTPGGLLELLGTALLWAIAFGASNRHTGVLLMMGRDVYRGRLSLAGTPDRLIATLPHRLLDISGVVQERALRVIASEAHGWRGELRTNPAWSAFGRRLTVHSQGGCPMSGVAGQGVTDPYGEVHGCKGLYVMDAAAFPTSVGVNPSATIAAVAEFKVERFIREVRRDRSWCARDRAAAVEWFEQNGRRRQLDPLNHMPMSPASAPAPEIIGLTFDEHLRGFVSPVTDAPLDFADPMRVAGHISRFLAAEAAVKAEGERVDATLRACVSDLARLIGAERRATPARVRLEGSVRIEDRQYTVADESSLTMFVAPAGDPVPPIRFFKYRLRLEGDGGPLDLYGVKVLRNDDGRDVWYDTSTTYVEITGDGRVRRGIMRVSLLEFLQEQLPSMQITGTTDSVRKIWALTAFYKYFAEELSTVYMARGEEFMKLVVGAVSTIHV